jgi:hypothetical protein
MDSRPAPWAASGEDSSKAGARVRCYARALFLSNTAGERAELLRQHYTDQEPESCFLLEVDGEIRGYLLGSRKPLRNQLYRPLPKRLAVPLVYARFKVGP